MAHPHLKVEWSSVITISGALYVMTTGTITMLKLCVDNSSTAHLVSYLTILYYAIILSTFKA